MKSQRYKNVKIIKLFLIIIILSRVNDNPNECITIYVGTVFFWDTGQIFKACDIVFLFLYNLFTIIICCFMLVFVNNCKSNYFPKRGMTTC